MSSFPQFWNPLWPWLQRWPPDGDVSTHIQILAEPLLAGFWQRWYFFGRFLAILNIPMQIDITKSERKIFSTHVWMPIYLDVDFSCFSKFGQIHTHKNMHVFFGGFSNSDHLAHCLNWQIHLSWNSCKENQGPKSTPPKKVARKDVVWPEWPWVGWWSSPYFVIAPQTAPLLADSSLLSGSTYSSPFPFSQPFSLFSFFVSWSTNWTNNYSTN